MVSGSIHAVGPVDDVVDQYLGLLQSSSSEADNPTRGGDGSVRIEQVRLLGQGGQQTTVVLGGDDLTVAIDYHNIQRRRNVSLRLNIYNDRGTLVTSGHTELTNPDLGPLHDRGTLLCHVSRLPLTLGTYRIAVAISADSVETDVLPAAAMFDVVSSIYYSTGRATPSSTAAFLLDHTWEHVPAELPVTATPS